MKTQYEVWVRVDETSDWKFYFSGTWDDCRAKMKYACTVDKYEEATLR